jgi:hypothetical protein
MASNAAKTGLYVGVGISVFIVLVVVGLILFFVLRGGIGEPTKATTDPGKLDEIELNPDVSSLVKVPEISAGGAEQLYSEAFGLAIKQGDSFVTAVKTERDPEQNTAYKAILDKLVEASDKGMGSEVVLNFDSVLSMDPKTEYGIRDTLVAMAILTEKVGMDARASKDRAKAEKYFRAGYVFGQRLWRQGAYVAYKSGGLGAMSGALANLNRTYSADFFNEPAKAEKAKELSSALRDVSVRWEEKKKDVAPHRNPNRMEPGDLYNVAEHDKDRAWRLEGIIWLGAVQWTNAGGNQRKAIQTYLQGKAGSGDPLMAQKAREAVEFKRSDVGLIPTS